MKKLAYIACAVFFVCQACAWSGEDIMTMNPGSAYQAPDRSGRPMAARQDGRSQLHVNQVRLRLPSSGPVTVKQEFERIETGVTRYDDYIDFNQAHSIEPPSMGIPGLISPEMLAVDYNFQSLSAFEVEPVATAQVSEWSSNFEIPGVAAPLGAFDDLPALPSASQTAGEPLVVEMPPPISAIDLPPPPHGGRVYEDVPVFYSSVPPVEAWSSPRIR